MASSRKEDLHKYLAQAFDKAAKEYQTAYFDMPQPIITCTFRSESEQAALYQKGKTKHNAKTSLHNYLPSFAFDICFIDIESNLVFDKVLYEKFASIICRDRNILWGGSIPERESITHFAFKNFTWKDADLGKLPTLKQ